MAELSLVDKPIDWRNVNVEGGIEVPSADTLHNAAKYRYGVQAEAAGNAIPLVESAPAPGMVKAVPEVPTSQPNFLRRLLGKSRGSAGASWISRMAPKVAGFGAKASLYGGPVVGAYQTITDPASEVARTGVQVGFDNPDTNDLTRALSYAAHFAKRTADVGSLGAIPAIYEAAKRVRAGGSLIPSFNAKPAAAVAPTKTLANIVAEASKNASIAPEETAPIDTDGGTITMGGKTIHLPGKSARTQISGASARTQSNLPTASDFANAIGDFRGRGLAALLSKTLPLRAKTLAATQKYKQTMAEAALARYGKAGKTQLHYEPGIGNEPGSVINLETGARTQTYIPLREGETPDSVRAYVKGQVKSGNMKDEDAAKYLKDRRIATAK